MPCTLIVVDDLLSAFHTLRACLNDGMLRRAPDAYACAPSAVLHKTATVGKSSIGEHTVVGPHVVIEDGSVIGKHCRLGPGVVIHSDVVVGDNVIIGAQTVIGSRAFAPFGDHEIHAMPSLGTVNIHNDVQIGAQCTIDRGLIAQTRINEKTLIDNMVHLGHDVLIGKHVIIAAQTGVAGCARIGDYVTLAGQVGIAPHATVDDGARISGKSLVHGNVKKGSVWSGNPSVPHAVYLREYARLKHQAKGMNLDGTK
jgi:UDP-3-O-[3-hydroxymyristoyl] glucosamine N-acyltransferase